MSSTIPAVAGVVVGGVVAALSANNIGYSLIAGGITYFAVNALTTPPATSKYITVDEIESGPRISKKDKKAAQKAAAEGKNKKNKKTVSAPVPVVESEDEEEEEEVKPVAKKNNKKDKKAAATPVPAAKAPVKAAAAAAAPVAATPAKKDDKKAKGKKAAPAPAPVESEDSDDDEPKAELTKAQQKKLKQKQAAGAAAGLAKPLTPGQIKLAAAAEAEKKAQKKAKDAAKKAETAAKAQALLDNEGWTEVEKSLPKVEKKETVKVSAKSAAVTADSDDEDATPKIQALVVEMNIPPRSQPVIIGAGGATLKLLTAETGARIEMPKRDSGSNICKITGDAQQVAAAQHALASLVERGFSTITHPGTLSDDLRVDEKKLGFIIGPKGVFLKAIQSKTQTRINLPEKDAVNKEKVSIIGSKDNVKRAKQALKDLIQDGFCDLTHEGWIKVSLDYPKDKLAWLIGPKGQTIKSIQGNTRTQIKIPEKNVTPCIVTIIGTPAGVTQAQKEIGRLLEPIVTVVEDEDDIPQTGSWAASETANGDDDLW